MNIIERINAVTNSAPNSKAYTINGESHSYEELKKRSDAMAFYLVNTAKLKRGTPIVIFGGKQFEMIVSFLGAIKAGHPYIPVDSHTPLARLEQILAVSKPQLIIAVEDLPSDLNVVSKIVSIKELKEIVSSNCVEIPLEQAINKDETFYIIFTSGTTGVPKGVEISHDNLVSFSEWLLNDFDLGTGKNFLDQAPYSFDLSVMNLYPSLLSGGNLVPLDKETTLNFKSLFEKLPGMALDVWVSTPSFADICLMDKAFNEANYPNLQRFLFCGEELTLKTATKLIERFPKAAIYNTYGPTEATVAVTQVLITEEIVNKYARLPIGRVKEDTEIIIVDDQLQPVPTGEIGEMIILGPAVSRGYLENSEKTAESFVLINGQHAYRTGDLGKFEKDLLFYQGRKDFQLKFNGYRIELEDIDHHLEKVSFVQRASVVPKMLNHKVQNLIAYVVAKPHEFEKNNQLTQAIKAELAPLVMDYMIPGRWVYVDQLPLSANGKVDRKALINEVNK
ncbi:D-alanine--poly(phosphoribitol) ligase subunit DltA [Brochothrix thermosphacta]|uniref:D-alanine--poly(phosphoribitol) ligase subunit DltA n=1 Tax=Brochothrix thermosphacta TaxID=2756 RepID=UPI000EC72E8C|nr:D-alanine--poly(phosphoribitol) ligase subunit DltA [Brochothrix thermosphacta]HCZ38295.1 D-alanine--poly(phosphoribitol) ligase subunit 1 [Brochothrix thermosphacta]HCZ45424.1 D-alanine--poly(phosphoribitol) ligase subunit 1 [Brochothrix thermosphacta]